MANGEGFQIPAGTIVLETAVEFDQIDRDLKELEKRGEEAGEGSGEGFRKGFGKAAGKAAGKAGELNKRLESTSESAERASEGARRAGEDLGEMAETAESAAQTSAGLAVVMGRKLVGGLRGVVGWLGRTTAGFLSLSAEGLQQAGRGLRELGRQLRESESRFAALGIAVEGAGSALEGVAGVAAKVASAITGMHVAVGLGTAALANAAQNAAEDFVPSWQRVVTIVASGSSEIERGSEALKDLRLEVSTLAGEMGVAGDVANDTFYQILSAMPEIVDQPEKSLQVLRATLSVVATGFAEGETAARAITSVLNAFQMEAEQATEVADMLFAAQDQGVLTFQQVATEIGKVSNLTSSMNAEFEDLLGILATVTPSGENVNRVMTQIRSVLGEMLDPTEELNEALGGSATGFVKDRGLLAALQRIAEVTGGNPEVVAEMFGRKEAQSLIITLSQNMDDLVEKTEQVANASGQTAEKVDIMNQSLDRAKQRFGEQLAAALRNSGFHFERWGAVVVNTAADVLGALNQVDEQTRELSRRGIGMSGVTGRRFGTPIQPRGGLDDIPARFGGPAPILPVELALPDLSAHRAEELVAEAEKWLERRRPIDRPAMPVSVDFSKEQIETMQAQAELAAFLEFSRTQDLEAYRQALEDAQRRVNDLVQAEVKRLEQAGVEADKLRELVSLYDPAVEKTKEQRRAIENLTRSLSDYVENLREAAGALEEIDQPELPGFESEGGAGFRAAFGAGADTSGVSVPELAELARFTEELNRKNLTAEERLRRVQERMDELGISVEDLKESGEGLANVVLSELLAALPPWASEMLGIAKAEEDAEENTRDLADEVENLAQLAGGIFQLADAFGIFGDEASDALQQGVSAATQLAQGVDSLKDALAQGASGFGLAGPIGAIAGGAAGIIGAIGGLFGGDDEAAQRREQINREMDELRATMEELEQSAEAVREVFDDLSGTAFESIQEGLPEIDAMDLFGTPADSPIDFEDGTWVFDTEFFEAALNEVGVSLDEFMEFLEQLPGDFSDLISAIETGNLPEGLEQPVDALNAFFQMWKQITRAAENADFSEVFEDFEGQMEKLRREFELFDIEAPIDQLTRMRDVFLEFADLPEGLASELAGLDPRDAEDRARMEQIIQELFRRVTAGEIGLTGEMDPQQFLDMLEDLEGTLDEAGRDEAGRTGGFQQTRGITEITANRIDGRLTTLDVRAMKRNELLRSILTTLGGQVPPGAGPGAPSAPGPSARGAAGGVHVDGDLVGSMTVDLPPGVAEQLQGDTAPEELGTRIGDGFFRTIDRKLAEIRRDRNR